MVCVCVCRFCGMGVEFDALPKEDFPSVKRETFETPGDRVSRPGFRSLVVQ